MFAHILLPLHLADSYLYKVPVELSEEVAVGMRCVVQFGTKRFYVGIIASLTDHDDDARGKKIKPILSLPDKKPIVTPEEIELWRWAAHYYMAMPGDFLRAALPSTLLPESETIVYIHWDKTDVSLSLEEAEAVERLRCLHVKKMRFDLLLSTVIGARRMKVFNSLVEKGIFSAEEDIHRASHTLGVRSVGFTAFYRTEEAIAALLDSLRRKPARLRLLHQLLSLQDAKNLSFDGVIPEKELTQGNPSVQQALRHLISDNILEIVYRSPLVASQKTNETELSTELLPSDKPTLYIAPDYQRELQYIGRSIRSVIKQGKRALLLLPQSTVLEGALERLQEELGLPDVTTCLYTGTLSDRERAALRCRLMETEEPMLIVGSRIASLLPARQWGIIVVAEEQDAFYKQQDPTPRYHARDLLVARAQKLSIPMLLSSVTPSAESYYNATQGKYHCVDDGRDVPQATIETINLQYERATQRLRYGQLFTHPLQISLAQTLKNGGKAIILSAQRGFAPYVFCNKCNETIKCIHCSVSLTYHQSRRALVCHYCGYSMPFPRQCPKCSHFDDFATSETMELKGFGSERMEVYLAELFPDVVITRIDADTFRGKERKKKLRQELEEASSSIYIGTQMLMQFAPIEGVALVGITQLDQMLSISNFRTDEFVFDLLYRLAISYPKATVLIQTSDPDRPLLQYLRKGEGRTQGTLAYKSFMEKILEERCWTHFPPFVRLINVVVKAKEEADAQQTALYLSDALRQYTSLFVSVSAPMKPYVARVRLQYVRQVTLRLEAKASSSAVRRTIRETFTNLTHRFSEVRKSKVLFDVDPQF